MPQGNNTAWIDVPDGTTIFISLDVPPGKFASGHVDCTNTTGTDPAIEDGEMRPGPAKRQMTSPPATYTYHVRITFGSACTVTLRAHLENDNKPKGPPFEYSVAGIKGQVKKARIGCIMVPPQPAQPAAPQP